MTWSSLTGLAGVGLLLVSCGDSRESASKGTARPIGVSDEGGKAKLVNIKEIAQHNGVLYQRARPGPFSGLVGDKWANGENRFQCSYIDGLKDGSEFAWHENGKRKLVAQFKKGVQEGQSQEWWSNGQIKSITTYLGGEPQGEARGWHANGRLALKAIFEAGTPVGKSEGWWNNGKRSQIVNYVNGKPDGYLIKWFKDGRTNQITFNQNGAKQGLETTWHPNGQKKMELNFRNGKANGDVFEWHPNGKQLSIMKYVNGVEHGLGMGWRLDGKIWWRGSWKNGRRDQIFTRWYTNEVKQLEMVYSEGILKRKSKFDMRGQITEDTIIPPGRTIHWTEAKLKDIKAAKSQIQKSFGRPEKTNGETWIYSGIHLVRDGKTQKVTVIFQFDAAGISSNVSVQP